jgi:hypothetical protein
MNKKSTKPIREFSYAVDAREFVMYFFPLNEVPPEEAKELRDFYELWSSLKGSKKIPSRKDISFETLKGWHTNIRLVDLGESMLSPKRNLILGELYKQYWGTDTMYQQIIESDRTSDRDKLNYKESITCFLDYNYGLSIGVAPNPKGSFRKIAWLDLPLSNGDNDDITFLITALIPLD